MASQLKDSFSQEAIHRVAQLVELWRGNAAMELEIRHSAVLNERMEYASGTSPENFSNLANRILFDLNNKQTVPEVETTDVRWSTRV